MTPDDEVTASESISQVGMFEKKVQEPLVVVSDPSERSDSVDETVVRAQGPWGLSPGNSKEEKARAAKALIPLCQNEVAAELSAWLRQFVTGSRRDATTVKWLAIKSREWWEKFDTLASGISQGDANVITMQAITLTLPVTAEEVQIAITARSDAVTVTGSLWDTTRPVGLWWRVYAWICNKGPLSGLGGAHARVINEEKALAKLNLLKACVYAGGAVLAAVVARYGIYKASQFLIGFKRGTIAMPTLAMPAIAAISALEAGKAVRVATDGAYLGLRSGLAGFKDGYLNAHQLNAAKAIGDVAMLQDF